MFSKYQIAIFAIIFFRCATANKFNISLSDLATCEQYTIQSKGYTYADFFQLNTMKNNKAKDNERLHLKFYVMTSMDAHILLSEVDNPRKSDRVYEIVLGAGKNSFSTIRIMMSRGRVDTTVSPDLLSVLDPMPVEIIQDSDGRLVVNIPNFSEPHLNYTDESPLNIKYVSFSSYERIPAKWYYDCAFDGFLGEMEMESRPMSVQERLTADILNMSETDLAPPKLNKVSISFRVRSVVFDQRSSVLNTRLHLFMNWTDSRLKWDPNEYGNVTYIVQPLFKVWHPVLSIQDGALETFKKFDPFYSIRIDSDGQVRMFARNTELSSWCFGVVGHWPSEDMRCEIILEIKDTDINLVYDNTSPLTDQTINELSEWSIQRVAVKYLTYYQDTLTVQLTIRRNTAFYHCVFVSPALVAEALILLALFLEKYSRGGLNLLAIVLLSMGFMFIGKFAPPTSSVMIVSLYGILMLLASVAYILHIISIWLEVYPPKVKPHRYAFDIINCSALRFILAMRFEDSAAYVAAQEYPWQEVSKILNRTFFIATFIICFTIDVVYFN